MKLSGKTALVTGAASGIGEQVARTLANEGAKIVIADMNLEGAKLVAESINKDLNSQVAIAVSMNVTSEEEVNQGMQSAVVLLVVLIY
jgi:3-hydroxybutyrate dehydrogenase